MQFGLNGYWNIINNLGNRISDTSFRKLVFRPNRYHPVSISSIVVMNFIISHGRK